MNKEELFKQLSNDIEKKLLLLEDKPEETSESTIAALWHLAAGESVSAENALKLPLPILVKTQITELHSLIDKRLSNIPLAHLTGRQNFMGIELLSDRRALIPRKETEILGNAALDLSLALCKQKEGIRVIDTCCGSGNLAIALAKGNFKTKIFACDLCEEALELTIENIKMHDLSKRIEVMQSDVLATFLTPQWKNSIDLIVCNPPYISSAKVQRMNVEIISYEPTQAFDGGMLGIKIIQKLIREAAIILRKGAYLVLEIGLGQGPFIMQMIEKCGLYENIDSQNDSEGNIRVVKASKK